MGLHVAEFFDQIDSIPVGIPLAQILDPPAGELAAQGAKRMRVSLFLRATDDAAYRAMIRFVTFTIAPHTPVLRALAGHTEITVHPAGCETIWYDHRGIMTHNHR